MANFLAAEIQKEESKPANNKPLNEQINFVESTFNSIGSIDKHKMDAGRFKSLLNQAVKKVEQLNSKANGSN